MMLDIKATFTKHGDEYGKFDRIENPPTTRPDLCAFLLLERLAPGDTDIVSAAEHDEIYLSTECDKLAAVATEADIVTLLRCGVRYSSEFDCLHMWV
ncbi:hypothetical protein AB4Y45_33765 [Paraburkholderia sp. EG287A]|uniref:hypothetical protein n=1 Tax=Paraburkholderia sp. EG287A TaxID=3237012 RepID=UPI0034D19294